jgi:lipoprotein-releasing system permease protein
LEITRYIAFRYLISKKSRTVVNIISRVALLGMIVGTMALLVVLSVFNGFDVLIKSFFSVFDPPLKITAAEGKSFYPEQYSFDKVIHHPEVAHYAEEVEEIAHLRFEDRQFIARVKGVNKEYFKVCKVDSVLYDGKILLDDEQYPYTVIGSGVAYNLGANVNFIRPVFISVPRKGQNINPLGNPFRQKYFYLSGVYAVGQQEVDDQYALVSIERARELLDLDKQVTAIVLDVKKESKVKQVQKEIQALLGDDFVVENRYQQHESYYRVARSERFFIYLIFAFILIIASFNLAGSIAMQIIDKRKDIHILLSFGATRNQISRIFFFEGWLISVVGAITGVLLGMLVCLGQQKLGWLKMPGGFAVDHYPVDLRIGSVFLVMFTVMAIGAFISWIPLRFMPKKFFEISQE